MDDRPFEAIYNAMKVRPQLLSIVNTDYLFCLTSPEFYTRKLSDIIGDIFKRFKQLNVNDDDDYSDIVVRNLAFGVSAGSNDLKCYEKW